MIHGTGIDIIEVARIANTYNIFKGRFLTKILSSSEVARFNVIKNSDKQIRFLATRWAAKEAVVKALGIGFRNGIYLSELTISNNELGQPQLTLSAKAHNVISNLLLNKKNQIHISLSDEKNYVIAYVIVEVIS